MDSSTNELLDKRRREAHPERIVVGGETLERNDIRAKALGTSERTLNRGDADGAPHLLIGGIKYRPIERHDSYLLRKIETRKPSPQRRRCAP